MEEFNILEFLKYYWSKLIFVLLFVIVGLVGSYIYTFHMQVPIYRSQTSLVLTKTDNGNTTITQNDISLNKNLVSTYREIVKSRRILSEVIDNLELEISYADLTEQVEVSSVNDTELIVISVYNEDNTLARQIANEIARVFKTEITEIYNIENVSIIDKALVSKEPYNVNVLKQIILGIGAGFLLGSCLIVVLFYMDDTVKTEEDIENKLGLSVLGRVPKYKNKKGGK